MRILLKVVDDLYFRPRSSKEAISADLKSIKREGLEMARACVKFWINIVKNHSQRTFDPLQKNVIFISYKQDLGVWLSTRHIRGEKAQFTGGK